MTETTAPTDLDARIAEAKTHRDRHFIEKHYAESSYWNGKLEILREWRASAPASDPGVTPGAPLAPVP